MRLTFILLTTIFLQVHAAGHAQTVTLSAKKVPLRSVFNAIEKQTGFSVFFNEEHIKNAPPVTIEVRDMPLESFLKVILGNGPLAFEISKGNILIKEKQPEKPASGYQSPITIAGTVRGIDKELLVGATIRVKGQKISTVTDEHGNFQITVEPGALIVISYVGYLEQEMKISNSEQVNITLSAIEYELDRYEVISTGYQVISRERSAGSYSKVDISTIANRSSSTNVLQRLDGLVPGLVVNNAPDAVNNPFLIRGLTSINSTRSPLIVVDGVELQGTAIGNINPQDVEDITVLKDATAVSIWGSKAANGVIVITTKKGRAGEKLRVEYDGYYNFQGRPDRDYIQKLNSRQFITAAKEIFPQYAPNNSWNSVKTLAAVTPHLQTQYELRRGLISQSRADVILDSLASIDNSGEISDIFYRDAATMNHTVSISGGGKVYAFYGSLSYTGVKSSTPGEKDQRYKVNLRQDFNLGRRLQMFLVTDINNSVTSSRNFGNVNVGNNFVPYQLFRDAGGNPLPVNHMGDFSDSLRQDYQARSRINTSYVPLNEVSYGAAKGTSLSGRIVTGAKVNLLKGLRFEGTYGYYTSSANNRVVLDEKSYIVRREVLDFTQAPDVNSIPVYWLPANGGRLTETNALLKNWTVRNQLYFEHAWKDHQLTVLGGQEATNTTPVSTEVIYRGWDDKLQISRRVNYDTLAKGITGTITGRKALGDNYLNGGEGIVTRTSSYYSNLSYSYQRKYTLNASWRIDQSNLFGFDKSAQNRPVWSVGGKWALGSENFMNTVTWLQRLDARFTYGIAGNAPTPGTAASFDILQAEANANYVTGSGLIITTPANNKLTWESTRIYNTGLDFTVWGGRLGGSVDGYIKKTHDLIGVLSTAPLTGYAGVVGNFGDMENKGIELSLNSINLKSADFLWTTMFTMGYNKNKITRLAVTTPITTGPAMIGTRYRVDYPAFTVFAYNYAGLNNVGDPQITQADGKVTADATVSRAEDVLYMGTSQPKWSGGLFNNFEYKGFQLGINISYNLGHVLFRDVNYFWSGIQYDNSMHREFSDRWKVAGDENKTKIPRYAGSNAINNNRNTGYYTSGNLNVFNASFAKIREITLAYNLAENVVQRLRAQAVSLRLQVSNLMLWKANHYGIDPEFQQLGARTMRSGQGSVTVGAHITL